MIDLLKVCDFSEQVKDVLTRSSHKIILWAHFSESEKAMESNEVLVLFYSRITKTTGIVEENVKKIQQDL